MDCPFSIQQHGFSLRIFCIGIQACFLLTLVHTKKCPFLRICKTFQVDAKGFPYLLSQHRIAENKEGKLR